jgi:hypothetical protein
MPCHYVGTDPTKLRTSLSGFEALAAVTIKSTIFWDVTSFSLLEVHRLFFRNVGGFLSGGMKSQKIVVLNFYVHLCILSQIHRTHGAERENEIQ